LTSFAGHFGSRASMAATTRVDPRSSPVAANELFSPYGLQKKNARDGNITRGPVSGFQPLVN
jgi:hypothetical protein